MTHPVNDLENARMIDALSKAVRSIGEDAAHDVTVRLLELKSARALPRVEAASTGEAWYLILKAIGIEQPDHYASRVARRVRAEWERAESDQRVLAKRRCLDLKAPKRRRRGGALEPEWEEPDSPGPHSVANRLGHDFVFKEVERRDDCRTLHEEIDRLPPEDRALILEVMRGDRTMADIARQTGRTPSAIRSRVHRIHAQLRTAITKRWGGQPWLN